MKKIMYVLVCLMLMLAVLVTAPKAAAETSHPHSAEGHCVCGGAVEGHNCQTVTEWTGISGEVDFGTLDSGNYYLTGDVTVSNATIIGTITRNSDGSYTLSETKDLVICLNGYNITATSEKTSNEGRVFYGIAQGSSLTITDCSYDAENGTWGGTVTGGHATNGGIIYTYAKSTLNIYGGNFAGKEGISNTNGGLIVVAQDRGDVAGSTSVADQYSTFNMFNGHLYGGTSGFGGNLNIMHYSHANIYGGIIEGGTAVPISGKTNSGQGGNIHTGSTVTLVIQGMEENPVVIRNGVASNKGGNLSLSHTASRLANYVSISNTQIYGGTATNSGGNLVASSALAMPGVTMYDCAPEVAAVWEGNVLLGQYKTVAEAAAAAAGDSNIYVCMMADSVEESTVSTDLYIDLAGYEVSGITCTGEIYGMDSATDDYTADKAGALTVTKAPQRHYKCPAGQVGKAKRYLAVEKNGSYSFHRFYVGVTSMVLAPSTSGMGYKASFAGSEVVKNELQDFGMAVSLNELADTLKDNDYRLKSADQFVAGEVFEQKLIVKNILTKDTPDNHDLALTPIYARGFLRLKDGTEILSNQYAGNLMEAVEGANDCWTNYTMVQKWAVYNMLAEYPLSISGWGVENAHHFNTGVWNKWTGSWSNGGHYYLAADYTLTQKITIPAGQSLSICLNGHQLIGDVSRMFYVYGTLNIHDHRGDDGTYTGCATSIYDTAVMAPVFYVYENGTLNLCGGNLTYSGSAVMIRGGVGMVGSDDTTSDSNTTADEACFNMYYGSISGGNVQAVLNSSGVVTSGKAGLGGNLDLVNSGHATLYRGTVSGGVTTRLESISTNGHGGNIAITSSSAVLDLYSVEITGGSSGVYVSNGQVNLHDAVQITGNEEYNLYVVGSNKVTTNNLNGASVGVTTSGTAVFTSIADQTYASCFTADQEHVWVYNENGDLRVAHGHCVCGAGAESVEDHVCEGLVFQALSGVTDLGTLSAGHYYLTSDITVTGVTNFNDKTVSICLNGYSIIPGSGVNAPLGRVRADAQLNICDCSGEQDSNGDWSWDGSIYAGTRNYGGITNVNANGMLRIYGGNFIGTEGNASGGVFNVCNDGYAAVTDLPEGADQNDDVYNTDFTMYNGYVKGGTVTGSGGAINCWHYVDINIYGGTVEGGTAGTQGGNISGARGTITVKNAEISGGTATEAGGNIYTGSGEAYFEGATVSGGTSGTKGGNIYMVADSNAYLDDTTVTGGAADMGGGVFNCMATVHVEGNTVIDGNENYNLHQFLSKAVDVGSLGSGARIGVYSEVKGLLLNSDSYTSYFYSEDSAYSLVTYKGNTMYLASGTSLSYTTPSGFSAGFGQVDISPEEDGVPLGGYGTSSTRLSTKVDENGRLYVMTTAVTDKNGDTILIVACDQIRFTDIVTTALREHMSAATGVPAKYIYINCSHSHSVPDPATVDDVSLRYRGHMFNGFVQSAILAMKDRRAATMQTGSFEVGGPNGALNFVRHYKYTDSSGVTHYFGDNFGTAVYDQGTVTHVSEADPTMHLVKFVRSGTDILLCNWRAHPHFTGGSAKTVVSSDYVGPFRDQAESLLGDVEVVFLQGAAGNINERSRLSDNHGYTGDTAHVTYGQELASQLKSNISCLKTVSTGLLQSKRTVFTATVDHSTDDQYENATIVSQQYWDLDADGRKALLEQYGFSSVYHAGAIRARYAMETTEEVEVNVFSIGDQVGFYTVPGELWDTASVEMEENSPFPITICFGYSLGDYKYFTYGSAWDYESYETANYRLTVPDTLLKMMDTWTEDLETLYNNAK